MSNEDAAYLVKNCPHSTPGPNTATAAPYLEPPGMREVSLTEAQRWWPWNHLLRATDAPSGSEEVMIIVQDYGSGDARSCDFSKSYCSVADVVQFKPKTVDRTPYFPMISSGAIFVSVDSIPPNSPPSVASFQAEKTIRVRGHDAKMLEQYRRDVPTGEKATHPWRSGHANVDMREIHWTESVGSGRQVQWLVVDDAATYSESQTFDYINGMTAVPG